MGADVWLAVGLGNPGPRYAGNRHNVGQMVLDEVASRTGVRFSAPRPGAARAALAEARFGTSPGGSPGPRVVLAKPVTYMNVSGPPAAGVARYYGIGPEHVLVVHDELDIDFGEIRLKRDGGEGGHNGLRDVSAALGTREYVRVRMGIGRPPGRMDPADFVLRDFSATERKELEWFVGAGADAVEQVVLEGLEATQLRWHTRR